MQQQQCKPVRSKALQKASTSSRNKQLCSICSHSCLNRQAHRRCLQWRMSSWRQADREKACKV